MNTSDFPKRQDADRLYEKYAKPLEKKYWGKFVAITPKGEILVESDLVRVTEKALIKFGSGNFVFKIGEKAVGRIG